MLRFWCIFRLQIEVEVHKHDILEGGAGHARLAQWFRIEVEVGGRAFRSPVTVYYLV